MPLLDTSVAVACMLQEEATARARPLLDRDDVLAADILRPELANALVRAVRMKRCSARDAIAHLDAWETLALPHVDTSALVGRSLATALEIGVRPYDMLHVLAAIRESTILLTLDGKLVRAVQHTDFS